jgi:hypothetical protein
MIIAEIGSALIAAVCAARCWHWRRAYRQDITRLSQALVNVIRPNG